MFKTGDFVQYGFHGICRVLNLETQTVNKKKIEYYVLEPIEQVGTRYYVPTQNEAAAAKLHPILSADEIHALLTSGKIDAEPWIADENLRKQRYRELLTAGDRVSMMKMVYTLHKHKLQQMESGRKFHLCDENFLRDARKLLDSEFSMVLGIPQDQIGTYIQNILCSE